MIYSIIDNFYLPQEELDNSPSRAHGISQETETTLRIFACELIQETGILLGFNQAVMATAQVLLHRFFCKKSMRDYNIRRMALACLFLSTKLEDCPRRTRDMLMVFDRINKRRDGRSLKLLIPETKEYDKVKERMFTYERILLKTFGFVLHINHPHKFVMNYVNFLDGNNKLQQLSWSILNDSLRTTLCVRYRGEVVACGAIYLAARRLQIPLPENPAWWLSFDVTTEQLVDVVLTMHDLYQRPKAQYIEVDPEVLKLQQQVLEQQQQQHQQQQQQQYSQQVADPGGERLGFQASSVQSVGGADADGALLASSAGGIGQVGGNSVRRRQSPCLSEDVRVSVSQSGMAAPASPSDVVASGSGAAPPRRSRFKPIEPAAPGIASSATAASMSLTGTGTGTAAPSVSGQSFQFYTPTSQRVDLEMSRVVSAAAAAASVGVSASTATSARDDRRDRSRSRTPDRDRNRDRDHDRSRHRRDESDTADRHRGHYREHRGRDREKNREHRDRRDSRDRPYDRDRDGDRDSRRGDDRPRR